MDFGNPFGFVGEVCPGGDAHAITGDAINVSAEDDQSADRGV